MLSFLLLWCDWQDHPGLCVIHCARRCGLQRCFSPAKYRLGGHGVKAYIAQGLLADRVKHMMRLMLKSLCLHAGVSGLALHGPLVQTRHGRVRKVAPDYRATCALQVCFQPVRQGQVCRSSGQTQPGETEPPRLKKEAELVGNPPEDCSNRHTVLPLLHILCYLSRRLHALEDAVTSVHKAQQWLHQ